MGILKFILLVVVIFGWLVLIGNLIRNDTPEPNPYSELHSAVEEFFNAQDAWEASNQVGFPHSMIQSRMDRYVRARTNLRKLVKP